MKMANGVSSLTQKVKNQLKQALGRDIGENIKRSIGFEHWPLIFCKQKMLSYKGKTKIWQ